MPNSPRLWWQDIDPVVWRCFGQPEDLARERNTAVLAALEELATRAPMSTPADIAAQMRDVGFRDQVTEFELRMVLDYLTSAHLVEPFRDYAALNAGLDAVVRRQEAWALTKIGRAVVARCARLSSTRGGRCNCRAVFSTASNARSVI
ncbi:hypothetical protein GCM10027614_21080 [Micromonospora vulcania]